MEFKFCNENSFIKLSLLGIFDDTNDFKFNLNVRCESFIIENKIVFASKNELENFYQDLNKCYNKLEGEVQSNFEYDQDIIIKLSFDKLGGVIIFCDIFYYGEFTSKCHVEFRTDQTFIANTLTEIKCILNH